jgi:hypothetical protein
VGESQEPPLTEDERARARDEVAKVVQAVSEHTGLPSNWNGKVRIVPNALARGLKDFDCHIELGESTVRDPTRWRTLIHEALHSVSAGFNGVDYNQFVGWEEGAVENLQRLIRTPVLKKLSVVADESAMAAVEEAHVYNDYVQRLDELRAATRLDAEAFYVGLLRTPIRNRETYIMSLRGKIPASRFVKALEVNGRIKDGLRRKKVTEWSLP